MNADRFIFEWFQGQQTPFLNAQAISLTALGSTVVLLPLGLLACGLMLAGGRNHAAFDFAFCVLTALALQQEAKVIIGRARPQPYTALVPHLNTPSCPSTAATMSAVLYHCLALAWQGKGRGLLLATACLLSLAIGLSRLYLGVHWTTDVLAGWTLGGSLAIAFGRMQARYPPSGSSWDAGPLAEPETTLPSVEGSAFSI